MLVAIVLSHSTYDDTTVAVRRRVLESYDVSAWADSQRLSARVRPYLCPWHKGVRGKNAIKHCKGVHP
jgi:hypothetical protein